MKQGPLLSAVNAAQRCLRRCASVANATGQGSFPSSAVRWPPVPLHSPHSRVFHLSLGLALLTALARTPLNSFHGLARGPGPFGRESRLPPPPTWPRPQCAKRECRDNWQAGLMGTDGHPPQGCPGLTFQAWRIVGHEPLHRNCNSGSGFPCNICDQDSFELETPPPPDPPS